MVIIEDTRNPASKHANIHAQIEALGHKIIRSKLLVGDYTLSTSQAICIDTKANLQEVAGNLCQQHERFRAECLRAQEAGIRLIILIEHGGAIKDIESVRMWQNPRLKTSPKAITGARMAAVMESMAAKYGIEWQFCAKSQTGKRIVEILSGQEAKT
jgi:ERCC4-type nuclease